MVCRGTVGADRELVRLLQNARKEMMALNSSSVRDCIF